MPRRALSDLPQYHAPDRAAWRAWLAEHHESSDGVWLIYYKKGTDGSSVSYEDAVREALCFGWIDSTTRSLDDERYMQLFTPRKAGSGWSASNKRRVEELLAEDAFAPAGLEKLDAAKSDGSWSLLDEVEAMIVPDDLAAALAADPTAEANWHAFARSSRKSHLGWLVMAKTAPTRERRIAEIVRLAAQNLRANFPEAKGH